MYSDKNLVHILTILEAVEKCFIFTGGFHDFNDFVWHNDQINYNACISLLIAIGEETKNIDNGLKDEFPVINWKAVAGMRDVFAHNYRGIDPEIVFDTIKQNLNELKIVLIESLNKIAFDKNMLTHALASDYYKHIGYLKNYF